MKNLFITAALVATSVSAIACPDLSGSYNSCTIESYESDTPQGYPEATPFLTIDQEETDQGLMYTFIYEADPNDPDDEMRSIDSTIAGQTSTNTVPDAPDMTYTIASKCSANSLSIQIDISSSMENIQVTQEYTKTVDGIRIVETDSMMGSKTTTTCKK